MKTNRHITPRDRTRSAFTLIELLVVIGIIAVLIGILVPVLSAARSRGRMTACSNNLRQLMIGMRGYLDANSDVYPYASFMPSFDPTPLLNPPALFIVDSLSTYLAGETKVWACPADVGGIDRGLPNGTQTYFATERSSYEYRTRLNGLSIKEILERRAEFLGTHIAENTYWIFRDYDNFHGVAGKPGARRYVYNDSHVADYEN